MGEMSMELNCNADALNASQSPEEAIVESKRERTVAADFSLGNGMQVVVIPDHSMPIVTHMVWYKAGAADEPPGKSGIAHFLEHLMFKCTRRHKAGAFRKAVAEFGGRDNAFTSFDYTAFFQTIPPEALGTIMEFEADRMRHIELSETAVATERDVILEERRWRVEDSPSARLDEALRATLYQNHPYGTPVLGWMHEMKQLDRADALAFYDRFYWPNNAVLVVVGDADVETVRALAEKTYGLIPQGPDVLGRNRPQEPKQDTSRTVVLKDPRVSVPQLTISWVTTSYTSADHGEAVALLLLADILGGGQHSRLYKELVVQRGVATKASAAFEGQALDRSRFRVHGSPKADATIADVHRGINEAIENIKTSGVTDEALDRSRRRLIRGMIFACDQTHQLATIYGRALATGSTVEDLHAWPRRIQGVMPADVQSVAKKYLDPDRSVVGYLAPHQAEVGANS